MPSFKDYYEKYGKVPENLAIGFSYLMALYSGVFAREDKYFVQLPTREIQLIDDKPYLDYFANGGSVEDFMSNAEIWGEDLTKYEKFVTIVTNHLEQIKKGVCLL